MRFVVVLALVWCACGSTCPKIEKVTTSDGGVAMCVQAIDCPRLSTVLICGMNNDKLIDCVACEAEQCVRYQQVACTP